MDLADLWSQWLWPILQLLIGFGLVIFVHELGHFLVAKWVGIKVETFAIGFGPRLFGFRRGETDYCIKALPLGGYVKMLGQEDFKPLQEGDKPDPRSYMAKSPAKRLAVVSAGVVMNVIFAALLFIIVCLVGIQFPAPVIGGIVPGTPASQAKITWHQAPATQPSTGPATSAASQPTSGFEPGDTVVRIDGDEVTDFSDIAMHGALAGRDDKLRFVVRRQYGDITWEGTAELGVKALETSDGDLLGFGFRPAVSMVMADSPKLSLADQFQAGDKVVAVVGKPVTTHAELDRLTGNLSGEPVAVTVQRDDKPVTVTVQPVLLSVREHDNVQLSILGMQPRVLVGGIMKDSPAAKAGLEPGDIVVDYADRGAPTLAKQLQINKQFVGKGTTIVVQRDGKRQEPRQIVPRTRGEQTLLGFNPLPDQGHPVIAGVTPDSPAAKAGVADGDEFLEADGKPLGNWVDLYNAVKAAAGGDMTLKLRTPTGDKTVTIAVPADAAAPGKYDFVLFGARPFEPLLGPAVKETNPLKAIAWGTQRTGKFILMTYSTLRGLLGGTVSTKQLRGPVGIGDLAIVVGRESVIRMVYLMALISVSLAVINFLPIPVVDGGHALFLIIEKLRGKPVSVKVMNATQYVGLALLLVAFVAITWQDIARVLRDHLW
jgi:regulator of sigma E protease